MAGDKNDPLTKHPLFLASKRVFDAFSGISDTDLVLESHTLPLEIKE